MAQRERRLSAAQREVLEQLKAGNLLVGRGADYSYQNPPPYKSVYSSTVQVLLEMNLIELIPEADMEAERRSYDQEIGDAVKDALHYAMRRDYKEASMAFLKAYSLQVSKGCEHYRLVVAAPQPVTQGDNHEAS